MKELWLVRHGTTDWNASGKIQGHADIPLNAQGEEQARAVGQKLSEIPFDAVWCSDLGRARRTAQLAGFLRAVPDPRIRELDFGGCEGLTWDELDGLTRDDLMAYEGFQAPSGESSLALTRRVTGFVDSLPEGRHLLFTHGGVVRALLHECGEGPTHLQNGSVTRISWDRRKKLGRLCLLTGGVRSGKSTRALKVATEWGRENVSFLATAEGLDEEMRLRIDNHRAERAASGWETLECPRDAASALSAARHETCVLDCLTLLVTNLFLSGGTECVKSGIEALVEAWKATGKDLVAVTNEVGWGIVPDNALSRDFRDILGWANQRLMADATEAWLCVSGRALALKPRVE
jgi:adenosyl cobinamide kinase/adenosyl cobinamide phosphate guanylyltransferase